MPFNVRPATLGDIPTLRALRLQALTDAPDAFSSTYEREVARTPADWKRWLSPGVTFLLEGDGPEGGGAAGLAAGVPDHDKTVVRLMAMWVHPARRGAGAADALVAAVCSWAARQGAKEVRLHVAQGNERALRCYERNAFRQIGQPRKGERDGLVEIEMQRTLE